MPESSSFFGTATGIEKHIRLELHQIFVFSRTAVYPDLSDRQTGLLLHQQNKIGDLIRNAFFRRLYDFGFSGAAGHTDDCGLCLTVPIGGAQPGESRNEVGRILGMRPLQRIRPIRGKHPTASHHRPAI